MLRSLNVRPDFAFGADAKEPKVLGRESRRIDGDEQVQTVICKASVNSIGQSDRRRSYHIFHRCRQFSTKTERFPQQIFAPSTKETPIASMSRFTRNTREYPSLRPLQPSSNPPPTPTFTRTGYFFKTFPRSRQIGHSRHQNRQIPTPSSPVPTPVPPQ